MVRAVVDDLVVQLQFRNDNRRVFRVLFLLRLLVRFSAYLRSDRKTFNRFIDCNIFSALTRLARYRLRRILYRSEKNRIYAA